MGAITNGRYINNHSSRGIGVSQCGHGSPSRPQDWATPLPDVTHILLYGCVPKHTVRFIDAAPPPIKYTSSLKETTVGVPLRQHLDCPPPLPRKLPREPPEGHPRPPRRRGDHDPYRPVSKNTHAHTLTPRKKRETWTHGSYHTHTSNGTYIGVHHRLAARSAAAAH